MVDVSDDIVFLESYVDEHDYHWFENYRDIDGVEKRLLRRDITVDVLDELEDETEVEITIQDRLFVGGKEILIASIGQIQPVDTKVLKYQVKVQHDDFGEDATILPGMEFTQPLQEKVTELHQENPPDML